MMATTPETRQQVLTRLKNAGAASALIDHAEKMGYGKDSAMWEFADLLGLVKEMMQEIPSAVEVAAGGKIGKVSLEPKQDIAASLIERAEEMGYGKDSAMWEFADLLGVVAGQMQLLPAQIRKANQAKPQKTVNTLIYWVAAFVFSSVIGLASFLVAGSDIPTLKTALLVLLGLAVGAGTTIFFWMRSETSTTETSASRGSPASNLSPKLWSAREFDDAVLARGQNMSKRVVDGCRAVLVKGSHPVDGSKESGLLPSQIIKAIDTLKGE